MTRAPLQIQVIFDPACPWCFIGKRQLDRALALRSQYDVAIRWWPFLLNPHMPAGGIDRKSYLLRKMGTEARVSRLYRAVTELGKSLEIGFAFDRLHRTPQTLHAHRLIRYAGRFGRAADAAEAVFVRYFVDGWDIGDIAMLLKIGADIHLDVDVLRAYLESDEEIANVYGAHAAACELGINGVPAFVIGDEMIMCGAQEPAVLARMIDVARQAAFVSAM
jgi:predicted DsbA family dithiol-disulfide isomerase